MVKKRNTFDIDFDPDLPADATDKPRPPNAAFDIMLSGPSARERRGPMASAITEAAEATQDRARAEEAIRAENDSLAHEHVRLKKLGLITDLIPIDKVIATKLIRDRTAARDPDLDELKASIRDVGLSNPIRVEQTDQGFELIQGFRRLSAFRELLTETGDPRYSRIPAAMVPRGEPLVDLYRKMVDENMVRRDISFGEMAQLARAFAKDTGISSDDAVSQLYASAIKQKRAYIRSFARMLDQAQGMIRFPEAIPRALGLELGKALESDAALAETLVQDLRKDFERDQESEQALLRRYANSTPAKATAKPRASAKTTLRMVRSEGEARVTAFDGKVELRLNRDFSALDRARLQQAVEAFFTALDRD